ncbi:MAG: transposase [Nitrospirota bacterium]
MRESWPHAPPHYFTAHATYMITAATLHRKTVFDSDTKLDLFRNSVFELAESYRLILQAWAFFANHYHFVASFQNSKATHRDFIRHLHRDLVIRVNSADNTPGRRVMYEFWDTRLTFEKSWLARLKYVHHNPVHHALAAVASEYQWCSARWFETNARPAFVKSVYSLKTDQLKVPDDF